ncbi:hypothetical protein J14TS2_49050 [Bacillus sp. J14TS2]|nr:hypothetical protein J14TS2_49050 [Bacillus sp. J14TS2]
MIKISNFNTIPFLQSCLGTQPNEGCIDLGISFLATTYDIKCGKFQATRKKLNWFKRKLLCSGCKSSNYKDTMFVLKDLIGVRRVAEKG